MGPLAPELVVATVDPGEDRAARYAFADPDGDRLDPTGNFGGNARLVE